MRESLQIQTNRIETAIVNALEMLLLEAAEIKFLPDRVISQDIDTGVNGSAV